MVADRTNTDVMAAVRTPACLIATDGAVDVDVTVWLRRPCAGRPQTGQQDGREKQRWVEELRL